MNDRLPVDHFTALSIAQHSRLSGLERFRLLITMGLRLSQICDSKLGVLEFWGNRGADGVALTGGVGCGGLRLLVAHIYVTHPVALGDRGYRNTILSLPVDVCGRD